MAQSTDFDAVIIGGGHNGLTCACYLAAGGLRVGLFERNERVGGAAMTEELERLAASDPERFTQDQIWILIRAIKVQSQVLQMYVGHALLDV